MLHFYITDITDCGMHDMELCNNIFTCTIINDINNSFQRFFCREVRYYSNGIKKYFKRFLEETPYVLPLEIEIPETLLLTFSLEDIPVSITIKENN